MPLWVLKILKQNGWQATGQRNEQQQTAKRTHRHKRLSSHLIYLPQFSVVVRRGRAPVRPVDLSADLSPRGRGGNGGPLKGWGHFLCLRALAGKIKCLHSVSPALFQMPPLPFKRALWAWMANERFWFLAASLSFLSPSAILNPPLHLWCKPQISAVFLQ